VIRGTQPSYVTIIATNSVARTACVSLTSDINSERDMRYYS
jgi:hypothetical protein